MQNNKKYQSITKTAQELFFKFGTKRVTIEEICQKADVSKMTFYKFFKNKTELAKVILGNFIDLGLEEYTEIMKRDIPFTDKVKETIQFKQRKAAQYGNDFMNELLGENIELIEFIQQKMNERINITANFLKEGQDSGIIRKSIKLEILMYLSDQIMIMMNSDEMKNLIPDTHERHAELLNFFFYGILDRHLVKNSH